MGTPPWPQGSLTLWEELREKRMGEGPSKVQGLRAEGPRAV